MLKTVEVVRNNKDGSSSESLKSAWEGENFRSEGRRRH